MFKLHWDWGSHHLWLLRGIAYRSYTADILVCFRFVWLWIVLYKTYLETIKVFVLIGYITHKTQTFGGDLYEHSGNLPSYTYKSIQLAWQQIYIFVCPYWWRMCTCLVHVFSVFHILHVVLFWLYAHITTMFHSIR